MQGGLREDAPHSDLQCVAGQAEQLNEPAWPRFPMQTLKFTVFSMLCMEDAPAFFDLFKM